MAISSENDIFAPLREGMTLMRQMKLETDRMQLETAYRKQQLELMGTEQALAQARVQAENERLKLDIDRFDLEKQLKEANLTLLNAQVRMSGAYLPDDVLDRVARTKTEQIFLDYEIAKQNYERANQDYKFATTYRELEATTKVVKNLADPAFHRGVADGYIKLPDHLAWLVEEARNNPPESFSDDPIANLFRPGPLGNFARQLAALKAFKEYYDNPLLTPEQRDATLKSVMDAYAQLPKKFEEYAKKYPQERANSSTKDGTNRTKEKQPSVSYTDTPVISAKEIREASFKDSDVSEIYARSQSHAASVAESILRDYEASILARSRLPYKQPEESPSISPPKRMDRNIGNISKEDVHRIFELVNTPDSAQLRHTREAMSRILEELLFVRNEAWLDGFSREMDRRVGLVLTKQQREGLQKAVEIIRARLREE